MMRLSLVSLVKLKKESDFPIRSLPRPWGGYLYISLQQSIGNDQVQKRDKGECIPLTSSIRIHARRQDGV
jgi:hypothetical protein